MLMTQDQFNYFAKKIKTDVTKEVLHKQEGVWVQPWSKKLVDKAKKDQYIDLVELRQDDIVAKEKEVRRELPGGDFQIIYNGSGSQSKKKELTN